MTQFWRVLAAKPDFDVMIGEWGRRAKIALAMVGGSVDDERTFSFMNMATGQQRNRLTTHLELCVRFAEQQMFSVETFPFSESIKEPLPDY